MTRLVTTLTLLLGALVPAFAGEGKAAGGGDMAARRLWSAASKLFGDAKYAEAEKACLDILALNPSLPIALRASAQLSEIYCNLKKFDKAQEYLTRTEEGLKNVGVPRFQAKPLYLRAVLACQKGDFNGCLEQLKKAIASSEEAILWASENRVLHFVDIVLLDEASPIRREFLDLSDPENQDKELRSVIRAKCEEAKQKGKLVLLDFYGGW
jgi:tetratricopeptide (TPR) repeat protein